MAVNFFEDVSIFISSDKECGHLVSQTSEHEYNYISVPSLCHWSQGVTCSFTHMYIIMLGVLINTRNWSSYQCAKDVVYIPVLCLVQPPSW